MRETHPARHYVQHTEMATPQLMRCKRLEVLLVEDNPGDIRLLQEAFKEGEISSNLNIARDGEQALAYLRREGPYGESLRPAFILLDLNLPRKDGREVLAEIKRDESLRQIPVVILSTSTNSDDVRRAYDLHANCYVPKPLDIDRLVQLGRALEDFWLNTVLLPA